MTDEAITVETTVNAPIEKVWACWTEPQHISGWTFAQDDWEAPSAENDLCVGGRFTTRMQAKDGSAGFDFSGTYTAVEQDRLIEYTMDMMVGTDDDGRKVRVVFEETPDGVQVIETFDPENTYPKEMQRSGWQAILDNFKKYAEAS